MWTSDFRRVGLLSVDAGTIQTPAWTTQSFAWAAITGSTDYVIGETKSALVRELGRVGGH